MKIRSLFISMALSLFALNAWADEDLVVIVNKNNKIAKLSKEELQKFYSGEANKFNETQVKAKICINVKHKEGFYKKIGTSENKAEANKAKLLAVGKNDKVVTPKPVSTPEEVVEYIQRNADGGVCFISKAEYEKISDGDKASMKVVSGL